MRRPALLATFAVAIALPASAVAEGAYWTTPALLKDFFKASKKVGYVKLRTAEHADALRARLGYVPSKAEYVVFVARTGARVDGYAVIDDEQGQHEPITFGVKLDAEGRVERTEVMVYREGYGHEIREDRFRAQFVGRSPDQPLRFQHEVDAISGATISSKSAILAVQRALAIVAVARAHGPLKAGSTQTAARSGP